MTAPKNLNEAREALEAAELKNAELTKTLAAYENNDFLGALRLKKTIQEGGAIHFESERLTECEAQIATLKASMQSLDNDKAELARQLKDSDSLIVAATTKIADLEKAAKTAETRAREILGDQGGPQLQTDGQGGLELTAADLRGRLQAEKDPVARNEIYKKLKTQESDKRNGSR